MLSISFELNRVDTEFCKYKRLAEEGQFLYLSESQSFHFYLAPSRHATYKLLEVNVESILDIADRLGGLYFILAPEIIESY